MIKAIDNASIKDNEVNIEVASLNKCFTMKASFTKHQDYFNFYKMRTSYTFTDGETAIFSAQNFKKLKAYNPSKIALKT